MHEGKLRFLGSDVPTFPHSVNRSRNSIDKLLCKHKYSLSCMRNATNHSDETDGQRACQIGQV